MFRVNPKRLTLRCHVLCWQDSLSCHYCEGVSLQGVVVAHSSSLKCWELTLELPWSWWPSQLQAFGKPCKQPARNFILACLHVGFYYPKQSPRSQSDTVLRQSVHVFHLNSHCHSGCGYTCPVAGWSELNSSLFISTLDLNCRILFWFWTYNSRSELQNLILNL